MIRDAWASACADIKRLAEHDRCYTSRFEVGGKEYLSLTRYFANEPAARSAMAEWTTVAVKHGLAFTFTSGPEDAASEHRFSLSITANCEVEK